MLELSKPRVSLSPHVSYHKIRLPPRRSLSARLDCLPAAEKARRRGKEDTAGRSLYLGVTQEEQSFLRLQSYLDSLYSIPLNYHALRVVEENYEIAKTEDREADKHRPDDYYINFGKAIEAIKEDFPKLFQRDFDYSIFRDDLVFRDPRNTFQGIRFYKYMLLSLRWHGRIFFKHAVVRIHSFWPRQEGTIRVRWSIHAIPRIPWEAEGIFDGVSEYKLDSHGKVYEHSVDNIIFRDPPVFQMPVLFAQLSRISQSRAPIPSAWCRLQQQSKERYHLHRFSLVRLYFILSIVVALLKLYPGQNAVSGNV